MTENDQPGHTEDIERLIKEEVVVLYILWWRKFVENEK